MNLTSGIINATSAVALRNALQPACSEGRCAWIRLGGLSATADRNHRALLRELSRFGLGGESPGQSPEMVVLDWTALRNCAADGVALFSVLTRTLPELGVQVVVCAPDDPELAAVLGRSGLGTVCRNVLWIARTRGHARRLGVLGPALVLDRSGDRRALGEFVARLERDLGLAGVDNLRADLLVATVVDLLQNVVAHAHADHASALALLHRRKRPPEIEVGLADSGRGIVAGVLSQARHSWLLPFTDTTVVSTSLTRGLSGRGEADGGGVLTDLIRGLVEECGAVVTVRSDTALLRLEPPAGRCVPAYLSCGWGTQTLIRLRTSS